MSKPRAFAISAVSAGVIALAIALALKNGEHATPAPRAEHDPIAEPTLTEPVAEPAPVEPDAVEVTPQPAPLATALAAASVTVADTEKPLDEGSLLSQLHELAGSDPAVSLKLASEAVDRFPDSPNAPEFEWNVVKALFNLRRLDEAEDEARVMLSKYPDNHFTGDVVHHLLNHPPNPSDVP